MPFIEQPQNERLQGDDSNSLSNSLNNDGGDLFKTFHKYNQGKLNVGDSDTPYNTFFDEEFDIDIEYEEYERIEVPDFSHGRRGRFIHDFSIVGNISCFLN